MWAQKIETFLGPEMSTSFYFHLLSAIQTQFYIILYKFLNICSHFWQVLKLNTLDFKSSIPFYSTSAFICVKNTVSLIVYFQTELLNFYRLYNLDTVYGTSVQPLMPSEKELE